MGQNGDFAFLPIPSNTNKHAMLRSLGGGQIKKTQKQRRPISKL